MTGAQVAVLAGLAGFAGFYYARFLRPILDKDRQAPDEIDHSVARFKRRRAEQGLCVYCGSALDRDRKPRGTSSICSKCHEEMHPSP